MLKYVYIKYLMNALYKLFLGSIFLACAFLLSYKFYEQKILYTPQLFNQDVNGLVFGTSIYPGNTYKYLNHPEIDPAVLGFFSNQINNSLKNYDYFAKNSSQITYMIYKKNNNFSKKIIFKGKFEKSEVEKLSNIYKNEISSKAPRILKTTFQEQINHLPNSNFAYFYFEPNQLFTENENPILASLKLNKSAAYLNTYTKLEATGLKNFKSLDYDFNCDAYSSKACILGNSLYKRLEVLSPNIKSQLANSFRSLDENGINLIAKALDGTYNFELNNNNNWNLTLKSLNFNEANTLLIQMLANFRHDVKELVLEDGSKVKRLDQALKNAERISSNKLIYELNSLNSKVALEKLDTGVQISYIQNKAPKVQKHKSPLTFNLDFFSFADEIVLIKLNKFLKTEFKKELNLAIVSNLFDDGLQTLIKLSWD